MTRSHGSWRPGANADGGWTFDRGTKHDFYEKTLPNGKTLNTHVSRAKDKSMHPATFKKMCELQLGVTVDEFWATLASGRSARTEAAPASTPRLPTLAMAQELRRRLQLTDDELEGMTLDEARRRLDEFHSRPR